MNSNTIVWIDDDPIFLCFIQEQLHEAQSVAMKNGHIPQGNEIIFEFRDSLSELEDILINDSQALFQHVGLIVLDQNMPDINGLDLAKKIKEKSPFQNYRFAMCSSEDDPRMLSDALRLGAVQFISKALPPEQIYFILQFQLQQVHQIQRISKASKKRIRRALASGLIASNTKESVSTVFEQLNDRAQSRNMKIDEYVDAIIEHSDAANIQISQLNKLIL